MNKKKKSSKKAKPTPPLFSYKVRIHSYLEHSHHGEEQYSDWEEDYSNSFESIEKAEKYPDVVSPVDLEKVEGFLVWADWSTGDSFGRATRGSKEALALFSTEEEAKAFEAALRSWENPKEKYGIYDPRNKQAFTFKGKTQTIEYNYLPWQGFFERLENIFINRVSLRG